MNKINLKKIQQKIITSYFEDGIWDLGIGFIFLFMGILLQVDLPMFVGVAAAITVVMMPILKRSITLPRYGHIQLLQREKKRFTMLFLALFVLGLLFFLMLSSQMGDTAFGQLLADNGLAVIGLVIGGAMVLAAAWLSYTRMYFYGILVAIPFITVDWLIPLPVKLIIAGGIIVLIGVWYCVRFTQR